VKSHFVYFNCLSCMTRTSFRCCSTIFGDKITGNIRVCLWWSCDWGESVQTHQERWHHQWYENEGCRIRFSPSQTNRSGNIQQKSATIAKRAKGLTSVHRRYRIREWRRGVLSIVNILQTRVRDLWMWRFEFLKMHST